MPLPGTERLVVRDGSDVRPARLVAYAWGDQYVDELLSLTLPAALAPGNVPAVAELAPTEVVLLIQEQHYDRVADHPSTRRVRQVCPVRLVGLDDLIVSKEKYGMTLTYALHRGMRAFGANMTETNFLFLNSDFIVADGSLRNAVLALLRGERLVAAPSYCANAHAIRPELRRFWDRNTGALAIPPRALTRLLLRNLHNTVKGKTLNQSDFHLLQMDQFYWRVDGDTLLGHQMPVAIVGMRPERAVDEPNSFWDHGLIAEFCPNAKPHMLGDSDDFLMAELRDKEVAAEQIVAGPIDPRTVAERMIGWVTPYQRAFAELPLTLHAADLPSTVASERAKLAARVAEILSYAPSVFPSHRDHPQWNYHLGPFMEARHQKLSLRLGRATETREPPADLTRIDRAWWRLDGARKRHDRHRAASGEVSVFFEEDLGNRDPLGAEVAALKRSYAKLLSKNVTSALIPQVRLLRRDDNKPALSRGNSALRRLLPLLQRLAGHQSSLRRVRNAITEALGEGGRNVLVVGGNLNLAEELIPVGPGVCAFVSSLGARSGNLACVLDPGLKFDLCLWELSSGELSAWRDSFEGIRNCLNPGATFIGFCAQRTITEWPIPDVGIDVYLDQTSRAAAIFDYGRRAVATHGLLKTIGLVMLRAIHRSGVSADPIAAVSFAKHSRIPVVVTIVAQMAGEADVSSPEAELVSIPVDREQSGVPQLRRVSAAQ